MRTGVLGGFQRDTSTTFSIPACKPMLTQVLGQVIFATICDIYSPYKYSGNILIKFKEPSDMSRAVDKWKEVVGGYGNYQRLEVEGEQHSLWLGPERTPEQRMKSAALRKAMDIISPLVPQGSRIETCNGSGSIYVNGKRVAYTKRGDTRIYYLGEGLQAAGITRTVEELSLIHI